MKLSFPDYHLFQLLRRFDNQHLPLDLFLSLYFRSHRAIGSKDRQKITSAVYGITRWRSLIDHLASGHPSWERRYAIFQKFQPTNYLYVNSIPLNVRVSCPDELFEHLKKDHGEEKAVFLSQINNTEAPISIRVNPLKATREMLLKKWEGKFEVTPSKHAPYGLELKKRSPLVATAEFREGWFEIQDEASQLVANMLEVKPGDQVMDYCAGAGGKALAFAHKLEGKGQIYLHDVRAVALEQAKKRAKRAGIQNMQFLPSEHPHLPKLKGKMDWVLVDAPCSGTGTYRRNPDQKWKFSNSFLERLKKEQREIFQKALPYVKKGGKITYATCSILKNENERQADFFVEKYGVEIDGSPFVSHPSYGGMDGFFAINFVVSK